MIHGSVVQVLPPSGDREEDPPAAADFAGGAAPGDDLPYRVEVWDEAGEAAERVAAVTSSASVGYAAYYAAARENPGRTVTLSYKGRVMSKWSHRAH